MHRTRNAAYGQPYRGFESLPLRHFRFLRCERSDLKCGGGDNEPPIYPATSLLSSSTERGAKRTRSRSERYGFESLPLRQRLSRPKHLPEEFCTACHERGSARRLAAVVSCLSCVAGRVPSVRASPKRFSPRSLCAKLCQLLHPGHSLPPAGTAILQGNVRGIFWWGRQ
jgi:hypothetical protein